MSNQHVDLNFRAINYSGEVYLNGHRRVLPKGVFRRHCLDVTDILHPDGQNLLAVIVYPPDQPGKIPPEGGQGGDHEIGKDVATQYVEGWDWMAPIRDRNTGIWDEVSVSVTGEIRAKRTDRDCGFYKSLQVGASRLTQIFCKRSPAFVNYRHAIPTYCGWRHKDQERGGDAIGSAYKK